MDTLSKFSSVVRAGQVVYVYIVVNLPKIRDYGKDLAVINK